MRKMMHVVGIVLVALLLTACGNTTNDSRTDTTSAQSLQPNLTGFMTQDMDAGVDAVLTAAGTAALAAANPEITAAVGAADAILQCLQDVGAISGLVYIQEDATIPNIGASIVVNKTRVERNLFGCLTEQFGAASATVQVCAANGEFQVGDEEFWFGYVGVGEAICLGFRQHFSAANTQITNFVELGSYGFSE